MADNPYSGLPDHCFWKRSIAAVPAPEIDPVVSAPFQIGPTDRVVTAGSCFAQHIGRYLRRCGLNYLMTEPPHAIVDEAEAADFNYGTYSARYGNIYTVRQLLQLFKRAYGSFRPAEDAWTSPSGVIDPFRPVIQPGGFRSLVEFEEDRRRHFEAVRTAFETLDVLIFTYGLTEAWESTVDGAIFPLCPGTSGGTFEPARHRLHNFTVGEVVADSLEFIDLLRSVNPRARLIVTVSPVPLAATARESEHVLPATVYSKSVLRVACEEVGRQRPQVAYIPSYEIITGPQARGRYFADDCRLVNEAGVAHVMRVFLRAFAGRDLDVETPAAVASGEQEISEAEMQHLVAVNCEEAMLQNLQSPAGGRGETRRPCNLCGGSEFMAGPGGRMRWNGQGPRCSRCGSLERNRAIADLLRTLPNRDLACRRALLLGADQGADINWFADTASFPWPPREPVPAQIDDLANGGYDLVSLIHVLEFVKDDRSFFDRLIALLSPTGLVMVRFMDPERHEATADLASGGTDGSPFRFYGADLAGHFRCAETGVAVAQAIGIDPCTDLNLVVHFFARDANSLEALPRFRRAFAESPAR